MSDLRRKPMSPFEWGMLIVLSIFWGGSFLFIGIAVSDFQPFSIAFLRVVIAAVVLWIVLIALRTEIPTKPRLWASFLVMGAINGAIPYSLMAWGQSHIASGLASILIAATPVITVVAAHFLTADEPMTASRLAGVVAGLLGVTVLIGPTALGDVGRSLLGQLAIIAAATTYALASIYGRRYAKQGIPPLVIATGQVTASTLLLLPMVLLFDQPWQLPPPSTLAWAAIAGLGLFSTAIAYLLYFRVLATAGATNLTLVNFLVPITAIFLGIVILNEILLVQHVAGMLLIAGGVALIDGRISERIKRLS